jgi:hypothetical protein
MEELLARNLTTFNKQCSLFSELVNFWKGYIMHKTVWLVTHGETVTQDNDGVWIPNPKMSGDGFGKVALLRQILDKELNDKLPPEVHCGVGARQLQVVKALNFSTHQKVLVSGLWGDASTLVVDGGKRSVLLSNGMLIKYDHYLTANHIGGEVIRKVIAALPNGSVICSGRPVLVRLGMKPEECHNGTLYALRVQDSGEIAIELVQQGKILPS